MRTCLGSQLLTSTFSIAEQKSIEFSSAVILNSRPQSGVDTLSAALVLDILQSSRVGLIFHATATDYFLEVILL